MSSNQPRTFEDRLREAVEWFGKVLNSASAPAPQPVPVRNRRPDERQRPSQR
ncbi:MAG: hypothetical protein ACLFTK_05340 [Anaerolineales bacterium]